MSNDGHYLQGATKLVCFWQHVYGSLMFGYLVAESRTNTDDDYALIETDDA